MVQILKDDPNPIICYIIVRESLNLSIGKTAAQVGHSCSLLQKEIDSLERFVNSYQADELDDNKLAKLEEKDNINMAWMNSGYRKVVLKADDKEFEKVKSEYPDHILIIDAGLTEVEPSTPTVIILFPNYKDTFTKTIKRLQLLK